MSDGLLTMNPLHVEILEPKMHVKALETCLNFHLQLDDPHKDMEPIRHWTEAQFVIHGTRRRNLDSIKATVCA